MYFFLFLPFIINVHIWSIAFTRRRKSARNCIKISLNYVILSLSLFLSYTQCMYLHVYVPTQKVEYCSYYEIIFRI